MHSNWKSRTWRVRQASKPAHSECHSLNAKGTIDVIEGGEGLPSCVSMRMRTHHHPRALGPVHCPACNSLQSSDRGRTLFFGVQMGFALSLSPPTGQKETLSSGSPLAFVLCH